MHEADGDPERSKAKGAHDSSSTKQGKPNRTHQRCHARAECTSADCQPVSTHVHGGVILAVSRAQ
jgi:hypothetical protein